jgi:hypothetical protein
MTIEEKAVDSTQRVELKTETGKKFLRRVIREQSKLSMGEEWIAYARAADGWELGFWRNVKGKNIGDQESRITVSTDYVVRVDGKTGSQVKSFSDCEPVIVRDPTGLHLSGGNVALLAKTLADGGRINIEISSGSEHSSRHGLSFYSVALSLPGFQYACVSLGYETIAKDGTTICGGSVDLR